MRAYRILPYDDRAAAGQPGHPLYVPRRLQEAGRYDNNRLYAALYLALSRSGAVAEALGNHATWTDDLFDSPTTGLRRHIATVEVPDRIADALVDVDDARFLLDRGLRPTDVVGRARTRTRSLAADLFAEGVPGIRFWSYYRPEWANLVLFAPPLEPDDLEVVEVEAMRLDLPCVQAASEMLCRVVER